MDGEEKAVRSTEESGTSQVLNLSLESIEVEGEGRQFVVVFNIGGERVAAVFERKERGFLCTFSFDGLRVTFELEDLFNPKIDRVRRKLCALGLDVSRAEVEGMFVLLHSSEDFLNWLRSFEGAQKAEEKREEVIPDEIRKKAEELLKDPEILKRVREILDKRIVGEDDLKLLLFMIFLSKEVAPQAVILVGESGAGKSYTVGQISEIFIEDVLWFSRVTPAALDRIGRNLTGKVFVIEETAGLSQEAEAMLRAWISEGRLSLLTTIKDENGNLQVVEVSTEGKPVFVSTTTKARFDEERATRIWVLTPDSGEEQTKKVLEFEAGLASGELQDLGEEDFEVLRAAVRILRSENHEKPVRVLIPFARKLASIFPSKMTRVRRDFKKILDLVKVSAFLHQRNRKVLDMGTERVIIATLADFYLVWELVRSSIKPTLTGLTPLHEKILEVSKSVGEDGKFTVYDLRPHFHISKSRLHELVRDLEAWGFFELVEGGRGRKNVYKVLNYSEENGEFPVISTENLEEFFSEKEFKDWLDRSFHFSRDIYAHICFDDVKGFVYYPLRDKVDEKHIYNNISVEKWKLQSEEDTDELDEDITSENSMEIRGNSETDLEEKGDYEEVSISSLCTKINFNEYSPARKWEENARAIEHSIFADERFQNMRVELLHALERGDLDRATQTLFKTIRDRVYARDPDIGIKFRKILSGDKERNEIKLLKDILAFFEVERDRLIKKLKEEVGLDG
jgi:hypothetical protein